MEGSIIGQVRHGSATTTHAVKAAIQRSQASLAQLSQELGINPKTVAKWRKRETVEDLKTGPTEPRSTAEVQTAGGKLFLFVAIDRTSKFAVAQLVEKADRRSAWEFLEHLLKAVPYRIHTIMADNGIQFADQPRNRNTAWSRPVRFDMICEANGIEHRLTKPNHPWTNGQVERMNRTIKEATVKRFHYDSHEELRTHLADFQAAYNFARRLKTLNGLTPYEYICKICTSEPVRFILKPINQMPGLNIYRPRFNWMPIDDLCMLGSTPPARVG